MLNVAVPLVIAELGWMTMGIVDAMVVGRVSADAMGAVGLGSVIYHFIAFSCAGILLGLDTLVSQAYGARDQNDTRRSLVNGVWLSILLTPLMMGIVWISMLLLPRFDVHPKVLDQTLSYMNALNWGTLPLVLYFCLRRYLQSKNLIRPVMIALVSANLINLLADCAFVFGWFGLPAFGAEGAGWATCTSRVYMTLVLVLAILAAERREIVRISWRPDAARLRELVLLGLPASAQLAVEIAVFGVVTVLISRLDPVILAAHNVALNTISMTFMVPLGISSAAAVRVGQALGRGDPQAAGRAGWTALGLGAAMMACAAILLLTIPRIIARSFSPDPAIINAAAVLLMVAAFFQLFDGLQIVATGALRGAGDTRTPAIIHFLGYWCIGLPLGSALCFYWGWGAPGLWAGLSLGLILIGISLACAWGRTARRVTAATPASVVL